MQFWTKVGSSEKTWGFLLVRNVFGMQKKAEVAWKATLHNETREPRLSLAQYSKSRAVETSVIMPAPVVNSSQNPTLYLHLCPLFAFYPLQCNSPSRAQPLLEKHLIKSLAKAWTVEKVKFMAYVGSSKNGFILQNNNLRYLKNIFEYTNHRYKNLSDFSMLTISLKAIVSKFHSNSRY